MKLTGESNESSLIQLAPTKRGKDELVFPTTPHLLHKLNINNNMYEEWRKQRLASKEPTNKIYDTRLRPYQNTGVNFLTQKGNLMLLDEQRLGKTPQILTALKTLDMPKNIIVVPTSAVLQWENECKVWFDGNAYAIIGDKKQRLQLLNKANSEQKTIIIGFGSLRVDYLDIAKYKYNALVLDEAHVLRNDHSQKKRTVTKLALEILGNRTTKRFALTGTPAPNGADDIYGILHFLYPEVFSSYNYFIEHYFKYDYKYVPSCDRPIKEPIGLTNTGKIELLEFLDTFSIQRKRKEVMQWLPKYDISVLKLPLEPVQKKYYNEVTKYYEIAEIGKEYVYTLDIMTKQCMLAIGSLAIEGLPMSSNKLKYIIQYMQDYPEEQLIIVSKYSSILTKIQPLLDRPSEILIGEVPTTKRREIQLKFQSKKINVLLANIQTIGVALQLDSADTMIFLDSSYTYTDNIQCMDRIVPVKEENVHKTNQKIIQLLSKDTIDEYIYDMVYVQKSNNTDIVNNYINHLKKGQHNG